MITQTQLQTHKKLQTVLLDVHDLHMKYNEGKENEVYVLKGINLKVNSGEIVAIMGPSGCGKTTLLNLIGGLDVFSSGEILIDESSIKSMDDRELTDFRRDNIGYIFQLFNLFEDQTTLQNVALPLLLQGYSTEKAFAKAKLMLLEVGLGSRFNDYPSNLSGGEQQKVAIARALVSDPKLILGDEPTGDLDMSTSDDIMGLFARLKIENPELGIVVVTHSERIASQCDRIIRIEDGKIFKI